MYGVIKEVILYNGVVGMGEDVYGDIKYNLANNQHLLFFLRMRLGLKSSRPFGFPVPPTPTPLTEMFVPVTLYDPKLHKPTSWTTPTSHVSDDSFVASFVKGDKKPLNALVQAGVNYRLVPDVNRSWSNYDVYRLFSPGLSKKFLQELLDHNGPGLPPSLVGRGFMDGTLTTTPCSQDNNLRIIRMASLEGFGKIEHRGGPISVLQKLGLVDQVLPLSNWHFKIQKCTGVTDELLAALLKNYDGGLKVSQFHSFFNGPTTTLIHPPPPRNPPRSVPFSQVRTRSALVLEHPPLRLTLTDVLKWGESINLVNCEAAWVNGPSGDCACSLEFFAPPHFQDPGTVLLLGEVVRTTFFVVAPKITKVTVLEEKSICKSFLSVCASEQRLLPKEVEDNVSRILADASYLAIFNITPSTLNTPHPPLPPPGPPPQSNFLNQPTPVSPVHEEKKGQTSPTHTVVDKGKEWDEDTSEGSEDTDSEEESDNSQEDSESETPRMWGVESGWDEIKDGEVTGVCKETTNVVFNFLGEKSLF